MITFIHAADLHLDTPFSGLEKTSAQLAENLRQAPFQSFENIVDQAIKHQVDFVLLAGDLYNTQKINIKAQSLFIQQLNRLNQADIPVFLIRGNHDYVTAETEALSLPFPNNVYTYTDQVDTHILETKTKKRVALTGFSYTSQWIFDRKVLEYPDREQHVDLHIGLLHGGEEETNYAPFTIEEIRSKHYDYWALGHIHQRQQIAEQPLIYYPGNIQGLDRTEIGEKGCLLVEWSEREQNVHFLSTAPIVWETISFSLEGIEDVSQLFQQVKEQILSIESEKEVLVHIEFQASQEDDARMIEYVQQPSFVDEFSSYFTDEKKWLVSTAFYLKQTKETQDLATRYPETWKKVLQETAQSEHFQEWTEGIFHQIPSKYLSETADEAYRLERIEQAIAKIYLK